MELNSIDDVNALTEYQKLEQIQKIEKKIKGLRFVPITTSAVLFAFSFWIMVSGDTIWSPSYLTLIAVTIGAVGNSNVQRTDLLMKLFKLKYGK